IISGQELPRPRGSTAKARVVDPYVLVQVFGIPADCTERKTRTVSNEGNNPVFDATFEIPIREPHLALIRFVVLDDEFIGDDFIGQLPPRAAALRDRRAAGERDALRPRGHLQPPRRRGEFEGDVISVVCFARFARRLARGGAVLRGG
ncbi:unnamed protein product, partial [Darwinula stevensoni]